MWQTRGEVKSYLGRKRKPVLPLLRVTKSEWRGASNTRTGKRKSNMKDTNSNTITTHASIATLKGMWQDFTAKGSPVIARAPVSGKLVLTREAQALLEMTAQITDLDPNALMAEVFEGALCEAWCLADTLTA